MPPPTMAISTGWSFGVLGILRVRMLKRFRKATKSSANAGMLATEG